MHVVLFSCIGPSSGNSLLLNIKSISSIRPRNVSKLSLSAFCQICQIAMLSALLRSLNLSYKQSDTYVHPFISQALKDHHQASSSCLTLAMVADYVARQPVGQNAWPVIREQGFQSCLRRLLYRDPESFMHYCSLPSMFCHMCTFELWEEGNIKWSCTVLMQPISEVKQDVWFGDRV